MNTHVPFYSVTTQGISFNEFKKFCQFLNNLDDFAIAMKMYTYAQQPVSQGEASKLNYEFEWP